MSGCVGSGLHASGSDPDGLAVVWHGLEVGRVWPVLIFLAHAQKMKSCVGADVFFTIGRNGTSNWNLNLNYKHNYYKTWVNNDFLGQIPSPASSNHYFPLISFGLWDFEKWESTNRRTTCVKIVIPTIHDCGRPRGSILKYFLSNELQRNMKYRWEIGNRSYIQYSRKDPVF